MGFNVRRGAENAIYGMIAAFNANLLANVGSNVHLDRTSAPTTDYSSPSNVALAIASANASDLPTSLTLCKELCGAYAYHFAYGPGAHKVPDPTVLPLASSVKDLATAQTAANALKTAHGTHIASTTYHYNADSTNTIAAANASDQGTLNTLLNELKTDVVAHLTAAYTAAYVNLTSA